jgi:hypothetical protein
MTSDSIPAPVGATTFTIRQQWDQNFAAWEAAKVASDFADAAYGAAFDEAGGENSPALSKLADLADRDGTALCNRFGALMLTPAPDLAAVLCKMMALYGQGDQGAEDDHSSAWVLKYPQAVITDLERLQADFAVAWLDRWTSEGGSVVIDDDGAAQYAYRADSGAEKRDSGLGEDADVQDMRWHDGRYHGAMQALFDGLKISPAGSSAIKAHMRSEGVRQIAPQREQGK